MTPPTPLRETQGSPSTASSGSVWTVLKAYDRVPGAPRAAGAGGAPHCGLLLLLPSLSALKLAYLSWYSHREWQGQEFVSVI